MIPRANADPGPMTLSDEPASPPTRFADGALWASVNAGAGVLVPLAIFVAFARLLEPEAVGLVALAVACVEMLKPLGGPGLYEALLQHPPDRRDLHESVAAWLMIAGVALLPVHALVIAALARIIPGVADHQLLLSLIGLRVLFDLVSVQPQARLAQSLSYRILALRAVIANALAGVTGIGIAMAGAPLAGLVTYQILQSVFGFLTTAACRQAMARPRMHRSGRGLLREGWTASAVRLVSASNNYLDQIVIGTVIGSGLLAFFNLAKRVETVFITASSAFSQVLFQPLFAATGSAARSRALQHSLALITMLCGLPAIVLAANSTLAVVTVFGPQWAPAATTTAVLAMSGFARAIGSVHGALLSISGRNRQLLAVAAVSAALSVLVVLPAASLGLLWCATALAVKNASFAAAEAWMTRHDLPGLGRVYILDVVVPLTLMFAGAWFGRGLAGLWFTEGLAASLARLGLSGASTLLMASTYLGLRHRAGIQLRWAERSTRVAP